MASNIDPTVFADNVPVDKANLRNQFQIAHDEISALQPPLSTVPEAPVDGRMYVRQSAGWIALPVGEAPVDGKEYVRQSSAWTLSPQSSVYEYTFNSSTSTPPATGEVRVNAGATSLYFHKTTLSGFNTANIFPLVIANLKKILLQDKADATKWTSWNVTASVTDSGAYWTVTVTSLAAGAAIPNGDVALAFVI